MRIIKSSRVKEKELAEWIRSGKIFAYPTDTVYGLGCDATNKSSVGRIRSAKKSFQPFSVIAPSKEWITRNFIVKFPEYLDKLPGPFTLVLEMKTQVVAEQVSRNSLGVRIPDHPLVRKIQASGVPFVTTSCNLHGGKTATRISDMPQGIEEEVDVAIDGGAIKGTPSEVLDLTGSAPIILRSPSKQ